jgi:hypothetical protein
MKISRSLFFLLWSPVILFGSDTFDDIELLTKQFEKKAQEALSKKKIDKNELTHLLSQAVTYPDLDAAIFEKLIKRGACVDFMPKTEQDPYRHTLVHKAIICNNPTALECLLKNGAGANSYVGWYRRTPLHIAAILDNQEAMNLLLRYAANPCLPDRGGQIPLHSHQLRLALSKTLQELQSDQK